MSIIKRLKAILGLKQKPEVPAQGWKAHAEGFRLADNPFKQHTPDHSIWRDDWLDSAGRFR